MDRKSWPAKDEKISSALHKFREKRRWQIALRRYVVEKNLSRLYAPYFGLDIKNLRNWFEIQFDLEIGWEDFGKKWQFDHIIPVTYFDFSEESELKLCWNFTNLRVESINRNNDRGNRLDILAAKDYFEELYKTTEYKPCLKLFEKIEQIELTALISTKKQQSFIKENRKYLELIENYSSFEFELLNTGRDPEGIKKEIEFFKKYGG